MKNNAPVAVATTLAVTLTWMAYSVTGPARAQDYPTGPVRIISGFSPGSTADITARVVGAKTGRSSGR